MLHFSLYQQYIYIYIYIYYSKAIILIFKTIEKPVLEIL
jgi:hypothetical protein